MEGSQVTVLLPGGLPLNLRVDAFSSDGRAIYVQNASRWSDGIRKIEFKPVRQTVVPGSVGLGTIWHLTVSQPSSRIFVSGISQNGDKTECGTYEIDSDAGTLRTLRAGAYTDCAGGGGAISPDGKRLLSYLGNELSLVDLNTGAVKVIKGVGGVLSQR
jgi:DNA-binding beta-propeller fold protein YncE